MRPWLLAIGMAVLPVNLASQSVGFPTPTFRAQVEYVEVDALVTDEQGRFVPTLGKEDFRLCEYVQPQMSGIFSAVYILV